MNLNVLILWDVAEWIRDRFEVLCLVQMPKHYLSHVHFSLGSDDLDCAAMAQKYRSTRASA